MNPLKTIRRCFPQRIPGPLAMIYEKVATGALCGFYQQVAFEITSSLTRGRVLDVGTGPGHLLAEIARGSTELELVGLDLSRSMLNIAESATRQYAPVSASATDSAGNGARISLVQGDVRNLPFKDGAFDLVVSTLSLHHWCDPAKGLQECLRVTSPGGQCWIYDLRKDAQRSRFTELLQARGLRGAVLGWIFKFHGVEPKDYEAQSVERQLGSGAKAQTELCPAYLKLVLLKAACVSEDRSTCCDSNSIKNDSTSSMNSVAHCV